jgi:hypothetical protein
MYETDLSQVELFLTRMNYKGRKAKSSAILILKFLVLINIALPALTEAPSPCPKGTFKSTSFLDDCSDCPVDPSTNCQNEGADTVSCEEACIDREGE